MTLPTSRITARLKQKHQLSAAAVIARSDAAISWYCVHNRTLYLEIATACGLAMTEKDGACFFCFGSVSLKSK